MTRSSDGDNGTYAAASEVSEATQALLAELLRARQPLFGVPPWLVTPDAAQVEFMASELLREPSVMPSDEQHRSLFATSCHEAIHGAIKPVRYSTVFRFDDHDGHVSHASNMEVARRIYYDLCAAGYPGGIRAPCADDFEWQYLDPPAIPWAASAWGLAGFDQRFTHVAGVSEPLHVEPRELIDSAAPPPGGVAHEAQGANVFWLQDCRSNRLFDLYDTASMVAALTAPQLTSPSMPRSRDEEDRA